MKKVALVLGAALALACASLSLRDTAGKIVVTAETALHVATDAELALRCGQATSVPGHCITPEQHAIFKADLLKAWDLWNKASAIYTSLPSTGTPSIAEITTLIGQVGAIIQEIVSGFPDAAAQAKMAADPSVASTLKVGK